MGDEAPLLSDAPPLLLSGEESTENLTALVAHEFRGSVHALQAYLSVLLRERAGPLTEVQQDFLSSMYAVTRRLERLTNDIQVLTDRHEYFSITVQHVNLWQLADACRWELTPLAQEFQVTLDMSPPYQPDQSDAWDLLADPIRIEQVLLNLLENAIRYAATVTTVRLRLRQSRSRVLVKVENCVEPTHEVGLWLEPFKRGMDSAGRHPNGSGLGLYVVTTLVRSHSGYVLTRVRDQHVIVAVCIPRRHDSSFETVA